jgi:hypothetical protein
LGAFQRSLSPKIDPEKSWDREIDIFAIFVTDIAKTGLQRKTRQKLVSLLLLRKKIQDNE